HIQLTRSRKIALAILTIAWALDLGYGLLVIQGLSLIKITLLLLSVTLALSEKKGGIIGCALVSLVMALISGGASATLSAQPPSPDLIVSLATLTLFFLSTLSMGISAMQLKPEMTGRLNTGKR
ncbi:hypothetical protein, partial [Desulfoluna sp.]|uniref:hypothetical protein n=1 Tax=Desulfoluna sp. TaxID=2045199 RepID=UPI00262CDF5D